MKKLEFFNFDSLKTLDFQQPYSTTNSKGNLSLFAGVCKPGIIVGKNPINQDIVTIRPASIMYKMAKDSYYHWKKSYNLELEYAFIPIETCHLQKAYQELNFIWRYMPRNNSFKKIMDYVERNEKIPMDLLQLEPINRIGRKTMVFAKYRVAMGCYMVIKNGIVDYAGQSTHMLGKRVWSHFSKQGNDISRKNPHRRISYYDERDEHEFSLAVIDIPIVEFKSKAAIERAATLIEDYLIEKFDPPGNKRGREERFENLGGYVPVLKEDEEGF